MTHTRVNAAYDRGFNILKLFNILPNFSFTTSIPERDYW